jgi:uncharacterized protein (TIGR02145 family)
MENTKTIIIIKVVFLLFFSFGSISGISDHPSRSNSDHISSGAVQTQTKTTQTTKKTTTTTGSKPAQPKSKSKPAQPKSKSTPAKTKPAPSSLKSEPDKKIKDAGTVKIGSQSWASANLNVNTFRNGDSIPEARTNTEWVAAGKAGKPAWCYYNNDPASGLKSGKLYNWYAVNDPRGLAPDGWTLPGDADWGELAYSLNGPDAAGNKMKSTGGWIEGNNGNNESGFTGLPGGYRVENGTFINAGSIGTWWSTTESKSSNAIDFYLSLNSSLSRSSNPRQRGESVRCLRKE